MHVFAARDVANVSWAMSFGINDGRRMNRLQLDLDQHPPPKSWNLRWQLVIVQWWWAMLRSTENVFDLKRTPQGHLISPDDRIYEMLMERVAAEIGEAAAVTITIQEVSISYHRGPIIHHPSSITHKLINTYFSILHPYPNLPNPHPPCTSFFPGWKVWSRSSRWRFVQRGLALFALAFRCPAAWRGSLPRQAMGMGMGDACPMFFSYVLWGCWIFGSRKWIKLLKERILLEAPLHFLIGLLDSKDWEPSWSPSISTS